MTLHYALLRNGLLQHLKFPNWSNYTEYLLFTNKSQNSSSSIDIQLQETVTDHIQINYRARNVQQN